MRTLTGNKLAEGNFSKLLRCNQNTEESHSFQPVLTKHERRTGSVSEKKHKNTTHT